MNCGFVFALLYFKIGFWNVAMIRRVIWKFFRYWTFFVIFCFVHSDYLFKLLLIGDSGVGKSCLLLRFAVGIWWSCSFSCKGCCVDLDLSQQFHGEGPPFVAFILTNLCHLLQFLGWHLYRKLYKHNRRRLRKLCGLPLCNLNRLCNISDWS